MTSKLTESMEQEWPKNWKDMFYGKFVFSDGYIAEQKPGKILAFIHKVRQEAVEEERESFKQMILFRQGFYSHPKELAKWLISQLSKKI
jgi:hypothetical protein